MYATLMPTRTKRTTAMSPLSSPFAQMERMLGFRDNITPLTMRTDISETDEGYIFDVELPGFEKGSVKAELEDGYLTISARTTHESEEGTPEATEQSGEQQTEPATKTTWLRRERYVGSCKRSYYVGEDIDEDAIDATFENGVLHVEVPKKAPMPEEKKEIAIS